MTGDETPGAGVAPAPRANLWEYVAVEPGQDGASTVVALTAEHIAAYARLAQNPDPRRGRYGAVDPQR